VVRYGPMIADRRSDPVDHSQIHRVADLDDAIALTVRLSQGI
jgi:hypothetical protein